MSCGITVGNTVIQEDNPTLSPCQFNLIPSSPSLSFAYSALDGELTLSLFPWNEWLSLWISHSGTYVDCLQYVTAESAQVHLGHWKFCFSCAWAQLGLLPGLGITYWVLHRSKCDKGHWNWQDKHHSPDYYAITTDLHCFDLALYGIHKLSASRLQAPAKQT